ncbi:hypothetical protein HDV01_003282 [Terramyces sp. JEL0728]|nr:hypothetical protein HDV01_003282 [Terramyces sp. JEL0728]
MEDPTPAEKSLAAILAQREQELEAACEIAHLFLQQQQEAELQINKLLDTKRKQQETIKSLEILNEEFSHQENFNQNQLRKKQQIIDRQAKEMIQLKQELISINEQLLEMDSLCADVERIRLENRKLRAKNNQMSLDKKNHLDQLNQCNDKAYTLTREIQQLASDYRALQSESTTGMNELQILSDRQVQELKLNYEMEIQRLKESYESEIRDINQVYNCSPIEHPLETLEMFDALNIVRTNTMDTLAEKECQPHDPPASTLPIELLQCCLYEDIEHLSLCKETDQQSDGTVQPGNCQINDGQQPEPQANNHPHKLTAYEYLFLQRLLLLSKQPHNHDFESIDGNNPVPLYFKRLEGWNVADSAKTIIDSEQEGWASLFKGNLTQGLFQSLYKIIQPTIEESVNDFFDVYEDVNPYTMVCSHIITGSLLSPLELVRTRIIVQSNSHKRKKYYGPFHALFLIAQEERPYPNSSILSTLYTAKSLIPTALVYTISPLIRYGSVCFIEQELGLDTTFSPVLYKLAQACCLGVESLVMAPIELARKRLQAQRIDAQTSQQGLDSCIETSDKPYTGILDVLISVVKEEGPRKPQKNKNISQQDWQSVYGNVEQEKEGTWKTLVGLGQGLTSLYRGFWPRYFSSLILFVSEEITKEEW